MAVGLKPIGELTPIAGISLGTAGAGIKAADRDDLALIEIGAGARVAAEFTRNAFCAAPVVIARTHLEARAPRYLLINSGNANAGMGEIGLRDALACCAAVAERMGCAPEEVLPFSTGVIGERLPVERFAPAVAAAAAALREGGWAAAARAIMTTDTVAKGASRSVETIDGAYHLTGICKGSGMIRPDMATMLAYLATDAKVETSALQHAFAHAVSRSFNRITVDGDTSTNDACVCVATGTSAVEIEMDGPHFQSFADTLTELCTDLAQRIVRDGEGATKFITIDVRGAASEAEGEQVAYAVAHSPLVKTAFFASDANWGRILAAVGRSGISHLDLDKVAIGLSGVPIVRGGMRSPEYTEEAGQRAMSADEITVTIELGRGAHDVTVWSCDLSHDYVRINAEYRS